MKMTQKYLDAKLERLNAALGLPLAAYVKIGEKYEAQPGNLHFYQDICGIQVQQMSSTGGGVSTPFGGYGSTKRETALILDAALAAVRMARETR